MRRAGSKNPVFMLDEIDKLGMDFRGDPASRYWKCSTQSKQRFSDHISGIAVRSLQSVFITTANMLDRSRLPYSTVWK
jgi:ATP-dependent Lon protease